MSYLLHCILASAANAPPLKLADGLLIVTSGGLGAAASPLDKPEPPLDLSFLLRYEKAIAALHAQQPVIPLRYGSVVETRAAIWRLLDDRREEFLGLLERLEGMSEMGLRVLAEPAGGGSVRESQMTLPASPGVRYLAALRDRYSSEGGLTPEVQAVENGICRALSGLYAQKRRESTRMGAKTLFSLFFLVPRASIDRFRERVGGFQSTQGLKLLLGGPWPPYNFV